MKAVLITSSILILLLAALRPLLRGRIDPRVQYALWLIAALRLLVPVEWAVSSYSALALLDRVEEPARVVEAIGQIPIPAQSYDSAHEQALQEYEKQLESGELVPHISQAEIVNNRTNELMRGPTLSELAGQYARPVWLGGAALMAAWFLLVNLRLRRRLKRALPVEADCPLPVYVSLELPSPCLCGAVRPAIYVTPDALADPDRTRHVLTHELTHYRHRDHWWAMVRCLCLCVYWFNPLVWWAAAMSRQDCELACDAGAIRRLGEEERLPYGRTLVAMIASGRSSLLQTATTMTGGKRRVKERVQLIARKPKTVIALALALVVMLTLAVGCTFTGAPEESPSQDPDPLSSDALTVDTLRDHLLSLPEELQENVRTGPNTQSSFDSALASYWMERPWTDYEGGWGWLLTVYRWNQEEFDTNYSPVTGQLKCFAKDADGSYYVTLQASDVRWPASEEMLAEFVGATQADIDNNAYMTAFEAIRAYAVQTVLETEGVEPVDPETYKEQLSDEALAVQDIVYQLLDAPSVNLRLAVDSEGYPAYSTNPAQDPSSSCLASIPRLFRWEEFDWGTTEEPHFPAPPDSQSYLCIELPYYGSGYVYLRAWKDSDLVTVHDEKTGTNWYHVTFADSENGPSVFDHLLDWYNDLEKGGADLTLPNYAYNGLDYTMVTSYRDVPNDPEQWFLVGQLPNEPVWMFTRERGAETMFQIDNGLTQVFPYQARFFGTFSPDGRAPQLMRLWGGGNGHGSRDGAIAVITHLFQGGLDQLYQLTAYNLDVDPVTAYVHDYKPLMEDFNENCAVELDEENHTVTLSYEGQTGVIEFNDYDGYRVENWEDVQRTGFSPTLYDYSMDYVFNPDGTAVLRMLITESHMACWTLRFTGNGFETAGFQFVEGNLWS